MSLTCCSIELKEDEKLVGYLLAMSKSFEKLSDVEPMFAQIDQSLIGKEIRDSNY